MLTILKNIIMKPSIKESGGQITREKSKQPEYIKYYSISSAGIFYLFSTILDYLNLDIILENKEDGLFVNFLYTCLEFKTVEKMRDTRTIMHIIRFLGQCCQTLREVLKTLRRIEEKGGESGNVGYVEDLANPEYDDGFHGPRGFIQGLKNTIKIEWLDLNNTKIIELEKNKLFKIYDEEKENALFLEIFPENNIAILSDNKNEKIREFYLEKDQLSRTSEDYAITYFNAITVDDYIDKLFAKEYFYFYPEIDEYESEFCEELLIHMHSTYPIMNKEDRMIQRQDYIAIAKDKTFQGLAMSFKYKIDSCHDNFIRLSQAS
jgi:hypothetical protein